MHKEKLTVIKIGKFQIEDIFEIKGRDLVLAGRIIDGVISTGNKIEFKLNNDLRIREITSVEGITHTNPEKINTGLLIKCMDNEEVNNLKESKKILSIVNIFNENLKLSELVKWLSTKSIKDKILFNELLLSNLTTMNRVIWSDENTDDKSKIDSLKWSNELAHRVWNIIFELKLNSDNELENELGENIHFYAKKSTELAGHLATITKSTINRFYYLTEKNNDTI
ncbi:hypothetical protein KIM67_06440 [Flagellimonas sp. 389]|uniref:hypothetical protein n=1 Tax=Flagellimonas sp. 389 TaxID=2835862 RepID=UPI001BD35EE4|nr:hypothetical protein [Flagellimonas sp. 389]MBS9462042.1 hypothetical protein [Flagellimonas sp. 389]